MQSFNKYGLSKNISRITVSSISRFVAGDMPQ
jgi:hypothetical protein